ncbi:MAG: recombinase family protein [Clostridia bacterium]|nr:recombinase family protein [Clostridia bacterium]
MKGNIRRVAIYSRKSKFTGKGESIGNQVELCREFIRMHYADVKEKDILIYEDEGFSGGNLERPDFKKMMKAARAHEIDAIIVYRLDRISRNISDFSTLIEELGRLNVAFISIREQFDTESPMGRAMMYIASVFSQLERETIAERIRDNMHELAKTGRWLGGITPTGFVSESVKSVTVDGKTKKACKLRLVEEEAQIVRMVYDLFLETRSLTSTEAELMRRGVTTKNGYQFTRFSIKAILQNPVYVVADGAVYDYFLEKDADLFSERSAFDGQHGVMCYNRTDQNKGKSTVYLPIEEWIIAVGAHVGLIPSKEWLKVQRLLNQNKSKAFRRPRSHEALLTGLLFCACGNKMYPKVSKRPDPDGGFQYTYVCNMKERSRKELCNRKNVRGNWLDSAIIEEIKQLGEDKENFLAQLEESKKFYTGKREDVDKTRAGLQEELAQLDKKMTALVDSLADMTEGVARRQVSCRIEALGCEREAMEIRLSEMEALASQQELSDSEFDVLRDLLTTFAGSIDGLGLEQQRTMISTLVRKVVWDGEKAHLVLFGAEGDVDLTGILSLDDDEAVSEHLPCEGNVADTARSATESGLRPPRSASGSGLSPLLQQRTDSK